MYYTQETKICSNCSQEKSYDEFYNRRDSKDGKDWTCKVCSNDKKKKWDKENPDKVKVVKDKWREEHPEYNKLYYENNKEILSKKSIIRYENNKEKYLYDCWEQRLKKRYNLT